MKRYIINCLLISSILCTFYITACYLSAERDNPNDPENLNEFMGYPVADTGQLNCYNNTTVLAGCGDADFPRQDADFVNLPNARSFTGPIQHPIYTSDYTTKDYVARLEWKSCSEGLSGGDCTIGTLATFAWTDAKAVCVALNEGVGYAGSTTWRLPRIEELATFPNYSVTNPAIDSTKFPQAVANGVYWSSSEYAGDTTKAWTMSSGGGAIYYDNNKTNLNYVRCVAQ